MVAEEVFVNCYNLNPIRIKHASILCIKKYMSKKVIFKVSKIIQSRFRSRNSDLRLLRAGVGAGFSAPQHCHWQFFFFIFVLASAYHR